MNKLREQVDYFIENRSGGSLAPADRDELINHIRTATLDEVKERTEKERDDHTSAGIRVCHDVIYTLRCDDE